MSNAKLVRELKTVYSKVPIKVDVGRLRKVLDKQEKDLSKMKGKLAVKAVSLNPLPHRGVLKSDIADTTIERKTPQPASDTELVSTITNSKFYDKRNKLRSKIGSI
jgi:hypothetical protein